MTKYVHPNIGVARGGKGVMPLPSACSHFVFERRFSIKNSVIPVKSNILAAPKFFDWLRHCIQTLFLKKAQFFLAQ